ncbi:MAG TPA: DUF2163 domain-containing protein [Planctomycetes bacterium]|jgi:hypothetical protein|nr:DUF2163 domain-containing protein [Planctomycetota bacterium]
MSYSVQETSTESGQPVELYLFTQNLGSEKFALTTGQRDVDFDGNLYVPANISRTSPKISKNASSGNITLTFPRTHPYVLRYIVGQPPLPDTCTIYRGHSTDGVAPEFVSYFSGEVNGVVFEGDLAKVSLTTIASRMARSVPRRGFSWSCQHVLYDSLCQVSKEEYRVDAAVTAIGNDGLDLDLVTDINWVGDDLAAKVASDALFFHGGLMSWSAPNGTQSRTIRAYDGVGHTSTVSLPFQGIGIGDIVSVFAGCTHAVQVCRDKFDNVVNYGGFPFVPTSNPFATGILNENPGG